MNIKFENLDKIDEILKVLNNIQHIQKNGKRWMSTEEIVNYLPYSKDTINTMIKNGDFIKDTHYYQKSRKRIFDKYAIDNWVLESKPITSNNINAIINEIISSIPA